MKNIYKERQRQIDKSARNDYNQNPELFIYSLYPKDNEKKSKLIMVNGKLTRIYKIYKNGVPMDWTNLV